MKTLKFIILFVFLCVSGAAFKYVRREQALQAKEMGRIKRELMNKEPLRSDPFNTCFLCGKTKKATGCPNKLCPDYKRKW
jgi:hypothetical protein